MISKTLIILRAEGLGKIPSKAGVRVHQLEVLRAKRLSYKPFRKKTPYDYCLLTSSRSWKFLKTKPRANTYICIGEKTRKSLPVALRKKAKCPSAANRADLLKFFKSKKRGSIFFPRSALADLEIPRGLARMGFKVDVRTVYTMHPQLTRSMWHSVWMRYSKKEGGPIFVGVTSPSAFKALARVVRLKGSDYKHMKFIAIGPTTAAFLRDKGYKPLLSKDTSLPAMLARIKA